MAMVDLIGFFDIVLSLLVSNDFCHHSVATKYQISKTRYRHWVLAAIKPRLPLHFTAHLYATADVLTVNFTLLMDCHRCLGVPGVVQMFLFVHLRHKFWWELLYREVSVRSGRPLYHPHRRELRSEAWQGVTLCPIPSALPQFIQSTDERISGAECLSGFSQSKSPRMEAVFLLLRTVLLLKCFRSDFYH